MKFSRRNCRVVCAVALLTFGGGAVAQTPNVPEPTGLWQGPMHGFTPKTLAGATVINAGQLAALISQQNAVVIDVANLPPESASEKIVSNPAHQSIPGAIWLPGAGNGSESKSFAEEFNAEVTRITGGNREKPVVTFCHPHRWGSWNAAKRLSQLGYQHVYWFPGGVEGWSAQGRTIAVQADAGWQQVIQSGK